MIGGLVSVMCSARTAPNEKIGNHGATLIDYYGEVAGWINRDGQRVNADITVPSNCCVPS